MENKIKKFIDFINEYQSFKDDEIFEYDNFEIKGQIVYDYIFDNYFHYYDETMVDEFILQTKINSDDEFYVELYVLEESIKSDYEESFKQHEIDNASFDMFHSDEIKQYMEEYQDKYDKYKEILNNWDKIEESFEFEEDFYSYLTDNVHSDLFFTFMFEWRYGDEKSPTITILNEIYGDTIEIRKHLVKYQAIDYEKLNTVLVDNLGDVEMTRYFIENDLCYDENRLKKIVNDNAYSLFDHCDCDENSFFKSYDFQRKAIEQFVEFKIGNSFNEITENEKKTYISDFLLIMKEKVELNPKIKTKYKKYMNKIIGKKFKI